MKKTKNENINNTYKTKEKGNEKQVSIYWHKKMSTSKNVVAPEENVNRFAFFMSSIAYPRKDD